MRTEELIHRLARRPGPVSRGAAERRLALGLAGGVGVALAWVQMVYGLRPDLAEIAVSGAFWQKLAMPLSVASSGWVVVFRLGHPGLRVRAWGLAVVLPVLLLWLRAAVVLGAADPAARLPLVLGSTWSSCMVNVAVTALPTAAGLMWALRGLAPTRPGVAGAAAGWTGGAFGACAFSLHCHELSLPFVAVWYVLGMALTAMLGGLVGRRCLRW